MYLRSKIKFKTGETKVWISLENTKTTTFNTLLLNLLEKEMAAHSSILAWRTELHGQRSLADHSSWGHKELDTTERLTLLYL